MNKPENKQPSELNVITKVKDLVKHTFNITNSTEHYPKKYRFPLGKQNTRPRNRHLRMFTGS